MYSVYLMLCALLWLRAAAGRARCVRRACCVGGVWLIVL